MSIRLAVAAALLPLTLAGCGPQTPEDARAFSISKCEKRFGRMAPDPTQGNALCTCMVDRLAEQGLEVTDVLGPDGERVQEITRSCGRQVGISLPM